MELGRDLLDFRLHEITKPTLIVWGSLDRLIPLSVGQAMHAHVNTSSLLIVDGCGHLAAGECAHPVLKNTIQFLTTDPPPPPAEFTVDGLAP